MKNWLTLCFIVCIPAAMPVDDEPKAQSQAPKNNFDPIDRYAEKRIEGWKVLVHQVLLTAEHRQLCDQALKLLDDHLYRITRVVPESALAKLQQIPIWVELAHPKHPCMCYHVSADWLRDNGMNPQKAGAVEIANVKNFLKWTHEQPWMVLHELAHGYHHQVLGYDYKEIHACYEQAKASKSYESVLHWDGRKVRAYALTNDQEYFAELTEAYFGANDFYPFVRAELKQHDPQMYQVLQKVWGVQSPKEKVKDSPAKAK